MGKCKEMKKYVIISGYNLRHNNRGNSALAYGTVSFLRERGWLHEGQEILNFYYYNNPFKKSNRTIKSQKNLIDGIEWKSHIVPVFRLHSWLCEKFGLLLPFSSYKKYVTQIAYEAADYGGDGFSDIYGDALYIRRFHQTLPLWKLNIPLIILPQTIGPFKGEENYNLAVRVLKRANHVFVRDSKFEDELNKLGIKYEKTKDLSAFMLPQPWNIDIKDNAVGINVSGLVYSNKFVGLENQFDAYPALIDKLITKFRSLGHPIYLIPHSYNYNTPEPNNDDLVACKQAYEFLVDKSNVFVVDKDMIAPEVKYVISKMRFFIGTRMHANFAAIYSNVPLYGLAYSYKFSGAFYANGLDGVKQTTMINNLKQIEIDSIIEKVLDYYNSVNKKENGKR